MNTLRDLFGPRKADSLGAPLEYQCARCGKMLHGGTGGMVSGGMEVLDHLFKRAK
jgi:hypothetical protein